MPIGFVFLVFLCAVGAECTADAGKNLGLVMREDAGILPRCRAMAEHVLPNLPKPKHGEFKAMCTNDADVRAHYGRDFPLTDWEPEDPGKPL